MTEVQHLINTTITAVIPTNTTNGSPVSAEIQGFELPQNYSILINKLERLALGLDEAFNNLSLDRKEVEIAVSGGNGIVSPSHGITSEDFLLTTGPITSGHIPPPYAPTHARHGSMGTPGGEVEYSRVVSDIWIGVILTLLIVSVIFFICSCFLYHKFQQWKNSYRTNPNEPVDLCRRYPVDFEAESLPSYTIVSGLPTYDDALEEFRKAGIILAPPIPMIKIFDSSGIDAKDNVNYDNNDNNATTNNNNNLTTTNNNNNDGDNLSLTSTCTCGGIGNAINSSTANLSASALLAAAAAAAAASPQTAQVIELNPEQLAQLSNKRLSLQIAFNSPMPVRRGSRPRIDLYREVNRNNLLRSHAFGIGGASGGGGVGAPTSTEIAFPPIHRSSSSSSLSLSSNANERNFLDRHLNHLHHRGSLC